MANSQSLITLQKILKKILPIGDLNPILANVSGYQLEPFLTCCQDVLTEIYAQSFPYKWNELELPIFYSNAFQQDYALVNPDGSSFYNVEWLTRGIVMQMVGTQLPKPWGYVETGRQLTQATGTLNQTGLWSNPVFQACTFPNYMLYYGTWGAGNQGSQSFGNNPGPGAIIAGPYGPTVTFANWASGTAYFTANYIPTGVSVGTTLVVTNVFPVAYNGSFIITNIDDSDPSAPIIAVTMASNPGSYVSGGLINQLALSTNVQQSNPICQIEDPNGNLLVVTTYGTCGNITPSWPATNAAPGTTVTDGSVVWTVVDPNGIGIRILPVPTSQGVIFQFRIVGQQKTPVLTNLSSTLAPFPDKYEPYFRKGVIAQCYQYSSDMKVQAKFENAWKLWLAGLSTLRELQDRELEENRFTPERGIMGGRKGNWYPGAAWPFQGFPGQ
jgi:hypothetical protein